MSQAQRLHTPDRDEIATLNARAGAQVIDWLILAMLAVMITIVFRAFGGDTGQRIAYLVWMCIIAGWQILPVRQTGQTLGKRVLGIRLVMVDTGTVPTTRAAVLRTLPLMVIVAIGGAFTVAILVVFYFTAAFERETNRGLADRLAGTAVVKA